MSRSRSSTPTTGRPAGWASYLRIDPAVGSIEVGGITFGAALQRTAAATEAMYLMAAHAIDDLGYRRYEWKCDDLNAPSRAAATRLGFAYEGTFRNATIYKGRSRDTAWFAITDDDWPSLRAAIVDPGSTRRLSTPTVPSADPCRPPPGQPERLLDSSR